MELKVYDAPFIAKNFSYKECTVYVEKIGYKGSCHCGRPRMNHSTEALKATTTKWSIQNIVTQKPTINSGRYNFATGHATKYLRLADSDDPANLLRVMCTSWEMQDPAARTLVLSLITSPSDEIPEVVEEGLAQFALVNSCWIISSGHAELKRLQEVGAQRLNTIHDEANFANLRITPWKDGFLSEWQDSQNRISSLDLPQGEILESEDLAALKNFTHCIFVDNGYQNPSSVSATMEYRHRLEKLIREDTGYPIVHILIGGEIRDLVQILIGLRTGFPLLVCAGTEGLADIITEAMSYVNEDDDDEEFEDFTPGQQAHLKVLLKTEDSKRDENNASWGYELLLKVVQHAELIRVFYCEEEEDFDQKICATFACSSDLRGLQALIRWTFIKDWPLLLDDLHEDIWMNFMHDTMLEDTCMCDCKDNSGLLTHGIKRVAGSKEVAARQVGDCRMSSVVLNSISVMMVPGMFVTFLTQLTDLKTWPNQMEEAVKDVMVDYEIAKNEFEIAHSTASDAMRDYYTLREKMQKKYGDDWLTVQRKSKGKPPSELHQEAWKRTEAAWEKREAEKMKFENVKAELYKVRQQWLVLPAIWAMIYERYDIAQLFWNRCYDPVSTGLTISRACANMTRILPQYDTDKHEDLSEEGKKYEKYAVQLIERYNSLSSTKAIELLRLNPHYVPDQLGCGLFICSLPIQHIAEQGWWNGFNANPLFIIIAFFLPVLIFTPCFSFAPVKVECTDSPLSSPRPKSSHRRATAAEAIRKFYWAPITKFYTHALFYLIFVFLYAYTLLAGLIPNYVSILEVIIVVELISFLVETVCELFPLLKDIRRSGSCTQTLNELTPFYKYDLILNALNFVTIVLALGRYVPFEAIKTLYVVSFLLHTFRLFKFYYFFSNLGPKLAMIERMLKETLEFLAFLLLFIFAAGIAMEALLYLNRTTFNYEVLQDIFSVQYYRLFGENNLELAEGKKEGCTVPDGIQCPVSNPLVLWILNFFLLIAVTILMNLLIAIFSNVFEQFESESRQLWKRARVHLLFEFKEKPFLPMPFSLIERIVEDVVEAFRACRRHCRKKAVKQETKPATEDSPLSPKARLPNMQAKLLAEYLKDAVRRNEAKRMETYLECIRQKLLPRIIENLEHFADDTSENMLYTLLERTDVGFKNLTLLISTLQNEVAELKKDNEA